MTTQTMTTEEILAALKPLTEAARRAKFADFLALPAPTPPYPGLGWAAEVWRIYFVMSNGDDEPHFLNALLWDIPALERMDTEARHALAKLVNSQANRLRALVDEYDQLVDALIQ